MLARPAGGLAPLKQHLQPLKQHNLAPTTCHIASKTGAHLLIRACSTSNDMASTSNDMAQCGSDRPTRPLARQPIQLTAL